MSSEDPMEMSQFESDLNTLLFHLFHSAWDDTKRCQCSLKSAMLITFLISLVICIVRIMFKWWHEFGKNEVLLNLYLTYSGNDLCLTCKRKAGKESGFIEEHYYTLYVKLLDYVRVQIFNPFDAGYVLSDPQCLENPEVEACLHIHNCGGLQSVQYEMVTRRPYHLLCLQSPQYNSVFIEENEIFSANAGLRVKPFDSCPKSVEVFLTRLVKFWRMFLHDWLQERHFCGGSILTIKDIDVNIKERPSKKS